MKTPTLPLAPPVEEEVAEEETVEEEALVAPNLLLHPRSLLLQLQPPRLTEKSKP